MLASFFPSEPSLFFLNVRYDWTDWSTHFFLKFTSDVDIEGFNDKRAQISIFSTSKKVKKFILSQNLPAMQKNLAMVFLGFTKHSKIWTKYKKGGLKNLYGARDSFYENWLNFPARLEEE